jgi:glycosyltransferase involved in cell wall biosynthesis
MKILISTYNPSGYLLACLSKLVVHNDILVFYVPGKRIRVENASNCKWLDRTNLTFQEMITHVEEFKPDVYICGGWANKDYLAIARHFKNKVSCVIQMDTPWQRKFKQFCHCLISRFYLTPHFDYFWCAGCAQVDYARKLGAAPEQCIEGCYCADTDKFDAIYEERKKMMIDKNVKKFLYVGRYIEIKNMRRMETAFLKACEQSGSNWELICIGTGSLWNERTQHPAIHHLGYKHPDELMKYVQNADVFVLPSLYEPWGVVIHEFTVMGLPIMCSNRVHAAQKFVREGVNGFIFNPEDQSEMTEKFMNMMKQSNEELVKMGVHSHQYGMSYTSDDWGARVTQFVRKCN